MQQEAVSCVCICQYRAFAYATDSPPIYVARVASTNAMGVCIHGGSKLLQLLWSARYICPRSYLICHTNSIAKAHRHKGCQLRAFPHHSSTT